MDIDISPIRKSVISDSDPDTSGLFDLSDEEEKEWKEISSQSKLLHETFCEDSSSSSSSSESVDSDMEVSDDNSPFPTWKNMKKLRMPSSSDEEQKSVDVSKPEAECKPRRNTILLLSDEEFDDTETKEKDTIVDLSEEQMTISPIKNQREALKDVNFSPVCQVTTKNQDYADVQQLLSKKTETLNSLLQNTKTSLTDLYTINQPSRLFRDPSIDIGKRATTSLSEQQTVTEQTLKSLHSSLEACPINVEADDPDGIKVTLLPHQKRGLNWLLWRETQKPCGGILADDMGLGKTLTMISLILKSRYSSIPTVASPINKSIKGGTLVICPASVMGQWEIELRSKVRPGLLSYLIHHGPKRDTNSRKIAAIDVVLTTYTIVLKETDGGPLSNIYWDRIICDEAHFIRNHKAKSSEAVCKLKKRSAWALTGTPIQNKELDYFPLLKFIELKPFNDLAVWKKWVDNKDPAGIKRLNIINKTILLRRTKEEIQQQGGLKDLLPKIFSTTHIDLDFEENVIYEKVAAFSRTILAQFIAQKAEKQHLLEYGIPVQAKSYLNMKDEDNPFKDHPDLDRLFRGISSTTNVKTHHILVLLLRLRQICCHPCLAVAILEKEELEDIGLDEPNKENVEIVEKIIRLSLQPEGSQYDELSLENPVFNRNRCSSKLRNVKECLCRIVAQHPNDKIVVVSQWTSVLDIVEDMLNDHDITHTKLTGKILVKDRPPIIDQFNSTTTEPKVLLLSLTAGGTGLNLIGGNHLLLIDVHWNPQLEAQACDRIYRVGQKKQTYIYKFVCNDTIEERIVQLQDHKLQIAKNVLSGTITTKNSKLTIHDFKMLFNVK